MLAAPLQALSACVDYRQTFAWWSGLDTPGTANQIAIAGNLAVIADGSAGLRVHDISDPAHPQYLGSYNTPGQGYGVVAANGLAYVGDGSTGVRIISLANPASPQPVGFVDTPGAALRMALVGAYLFVSDGTSGLQVVNVSNPASPQIVGTYDSPGVAQDVVVVGSFAYVADGTLGLLILDVSNPASPAFVGSIDTPGEARGLAIDGNLAYVADANLGLRIFDVSNPASPQLVGALDTPQFALSIAIVGDRAFVADGYGGVLSVDITNPALPTISGNAGVPDLALGVVASGGYLHVATNNAGHHVVDLSHTSGPSPLGAIDTPGFASDVDVVGTIAWVSDGIQGLRAISIANPSAPSFVGVANTPGEAIATVIVGDYAYVADYGSGLQVVDITNPASPQIVGSVDTPGFALDVDALVIPPRSAGSIAGEASLITGPILYVADDTAIHAIDASNPASPQIVGSVGVTGFVDRVKVRWTTGTGGEEAKLHALGSQGFYTYDLTTYTSPTLAGFTAMTGAFSMDISGDHAFIGYAGEFGGFRIANGVGYEKIPTPGTAQDVLILDDVAYLASAATGLYVASAHAPEAPERLGGTNTPGDAQAIVSTFIPFSPNRGGTEPFLCVADGFAGLVLYPMHCAATTAVDPRPARSPLGLSVLPNPGRSQAAVRFAMARAGRVEAVVHDVAGRRIRDLFHGHLAAGVQALTWDGRDQGGRAIAAGIYHLRVTTPEGVATTRYVALR